MGCIVECTPITVKIVIKVTLFNNYISKSHVQLEVEKVFCPVGVAILKSCILIGGISVTSSTHIQPAPQTG